MTSRKSKAGRVWWWQMSVLMVSHTFTSLTMRISDLGDDVLLFVICKKVFPRFCEPLVVDLGCVLVSRG